MSEGQSRSDIRAIRRIDNEYAHSVAIRNEERPALPRNFVQVEPGNSDTCDVWIPWCDDQTMLNTSHYIKVTLHGKLGGPSEKIHQMFQSGEYIYVTQGLDYSAKTHIQGHSHSGNGEYTLTIDDSGVLSIAKFD